MKAFLFTIPIIVLMASCASKPAQRIVPVGPESSGRVLPRGETVNVRHPEVIKAYPVGRYVEPRKRAVMHEAHTIYRVESTPRWNLTRPQGSVAPSALPPPRASGPAGNELTVELNRQRQATQAVMQSGQIVSDKLTAMTAALEQNRILAAQNAAIQEELRSTKRRLEALEDEIRSKPFDAAKPDANPDDDPW